MKKIVYTTLAGLLGLFLTSCDNTEVFVKNTLNQTPSISVNGASIGQGFSDSVKVSLKAPIPFEEIAIALADTNKNIKSLTFSNVIGNSEVVVNSVTYKAGETILYTNQNLIVAKVYPKSLGENKVTFTVKDSYDKTSSVDVNLTAFNNLLPTANLVVTEDNSIQNAGLNYILDATSSYDNDVSEGGSIARYKFVFDGKEFLTDNAKINYIFSTPGTYTIKLSVQDSDGAWSPEKIITTSIQ